MARTWNLGLALLCGALLPACAGEPADEEAAPGEEAAVATADRLTLADVAGRWTMRAMLEDRDSTILTYELNATADTSGWTIAFPGRTPIPVRVVAVEADSIVVEAGPYMSAVREGVTVTTHGVSRMQGDRLVGTTVARYSSGPDSVIRVRTEGTRTP